MECATTNGTVWHREESDTSTWISIVVVVHTTTFHIHIRIIKIICRRYRGFLPCIQNVNFVSYYISISGTWHPRIGDNTRVCAIVTITLVFKGEGLAVRGCMTSVRCLEIHTMERFSTFCSNRIGNSPNSIRIRTAWGCRTSFYNISRRR